MRNRNDFEGIILSREDLETLKSWVEHNTVTESAPSSALLGSGLVVKSTKTKPDKLGGYIITKTTYTASEHAAKYLAWAKKKRAADTWQSVKLNVSFVISVVGAVIAIYNFISSLLSE